ncbi:MAG TPA: glycosyl transferase family 1 [Alcanivorax sp.]|nr:glycosyl transferase family 1 [Alcanivorax sp.]HBU65680.1 glycosyl transferase family 1 [Alcanivorax sp.]HCK28563.1 glycosyl transferase family 1 [Alcanivorax sp.]|tara:strand:+ start:20084 stop:21256 length:1173 start_codon:yes stop_codon:yes gene_type:complete
MKVVHICLSDYYLDDRAYQENELVEEHQRQGHKVLVIASTQVLDNEKRRKYLAPGRYRNGQGVEVIRLPYHPWLPHVLAKSLRPHPGVYRLLDELAPDVILFHGMCGWELINVSRYKKDHPDVRFYVDTHTDFINSARGLVSKWGLHFLYYRTIVHWCLPWIDRILYISQLTGEFARRFYGIPESKLEFFPLGGHPVPDGEYNTLRRHTRQDQNLTEEHILFVQYGKQTRQKKLIHTLKAFSGNPDPRFRLIIVGSLLEEIREQAQALIDSDDRVRFLGWKTPAEIKALLCGADVYLQPGSQSATMQTSLCCRCVPVLENIEGHDIYTENNGWLVDTEEDLAAVLTEISSGTVDLNRMRDASEKLAREHLDYSVLARRLIEGPPEPVPTQ